MHRHADMWTCACARARTPYHITDERRYFVRERALSRSAHSKHMPAGRPADGAGTLLPLFFLQPLPLRSLRARVRVCVCPPRSGRGSSDVWMNMRTRRPTQSAGSGSPGDFGLGLCRL